MSSATGNTKSKKGIRGFLRDTFGRSSSHPLKSSTASRRPISQTFPSRAPNESHTPSLTSSSAGVSPATDERPTTSDDVSPPTLGGEQSSSQPTAPTTDALIPEVSDLSQSVGDRPIAPHAESVPTEDSAESLEYANPQPPSQPNLLSADIPAALNPPDSNSIITNIIWTELRIALQGLRDSSGLILPLASAADTLLNCFDTIEASARTQQDYEELAAELVTLGGSLAQHFRVAISTKLSKCVSGISFGIKRRAQEIEGKLNRGAGGKLLFAKEDENGVMEHLRQIRTLFRRLEKNLSMNDWGITNEQSVDARLETLNPVELATYDSALSSTIDRRTCTKGTCTEVLANLIEWVYDQESPAVYWMDGMTGTGKTTTACTFSERLERDELLAASFFFTRATADCRDATRMIPTIAYQLARYSIPFRSALYETLGNEPDARPKNTQKQFECLIRDPLLKVKDTLPEHLVVAIDALDECDDRNGVEKILNTLFHLAPNVPLKFFVTSQPKPEVYNKLWSQSTLRVAFQLHHIEKSLAKTDVELYLKSELATISPSSSEIEQLVQRSGPLYIYAATVVRYIRSGKRLSEPYKRLRSVLSIAPETTNQYAQLDALYATMLKLALNEEELGVNKVADIRVVLHIILSAQEPISAEMMATLTGIDDTKRVHSALQSLRPVLHHSEETGLVSTLHTSFSDFLFDHERSGAYFFDIAEYNHILAEKCFAIMEEQLRFNICDLESSFIPDIKVDNIRRRIQDGISPALAYTCRYWASHLASTSKSDNLLALLEEFLSRRLLFWMEVLNLRWGMTVGVEGLLKMKQWLIQAGPVSFALAPLAEDALNFVTGFASSPASQATPHIYISFLPFCPRSSLVSKHYRNRAQGLLELEGSLIEHREGTALATWDIGSEVYSAAYSPDGTRIVVGCEKDGARILDANDGSELFSLSQSDSHGANSVTFSPDGKFIASGHGGKDCSIRIWDAHDGTLVARPHSCASDIHRVSFSPDGVRIAFASYGQDVYIWNMHDGIVFQSPINHFYQVFSIVFSPDGNLVASSSSISTKGTIHLWNSHDGTPATPPLQGHTGHVMSVAFTPDGTRLVSGSEDKTIRVWNVSDGSPVGSPFKGHTQGIRSVAVSPNGTRIASGSNDRSVRVWNIDDGALIAGPFIGHTARICSVTYSPDGTRIISGSSDHTVRAWNVRDGLHPPPIPFKRHLSHLKSISSFGDGSQILSASEDSNFWVWDIPPCKVTSNPPEHKPLSSTTQSLPPVESNIVVNFKDHNRRGPNHIDNYPLSGSLKGHKDLLTATAVSADSALLVTGFLNGSIRLWDLQKGELVVGPFRGHGGEVTSLLSVDYSHVISCSREDATIRVWDTNNTLLSIASSTSSLTGPTFAKDAAHVFEDWSIREDGWVTNSSSHLLLWIPHDLSSSHVWPSQHAECIITKIGVLYIPQQELLLGDQWARCYLPD